MRHPAAPRKPFGRRFVLSPLFTTPGLNIPGTGRPFMNDLDITREAPRLDPIPFIVADTILVGFAAFIGWQAPAPLGVGPLAAISGLVALGAIAGLYPFVINHARRQEEALRERTEQIEALARTLAGAADQVGIAVASLPAIAESSARQLKLAEQLPAGIKAQIATLQEQLSATHAEENAALRHELDNLRNAQTDKLAGALAELNRIESIAAQHAAALEGAAAHLPKLADSFNQQAAETVRRETTAAVASLQTAFREASALLATTAHEARTSFEQSTRDALALLAAQIAALPPPTTAPKAPPASTPKPDPAPATAPDPTPDSPHPPEPASDRGPEPKPDPEPAPEPLPAPSEPSDITEPSEPSESSDHPDSDASPSAVSEPALSNDGFTRLVATAYIGIGNKLFIRGEGPGLRRDKGIPLQFVSIGKWRWESAELLFPAKVRVYKNDQIECASVGEITLEPGHHHEVTAKF